MLQIDTLSPYLFIIFLDYVLRTSRDLRKENGFKLTKERSRSYPAQTITDYADDIALLSNTPAQAKTLLHCLERAVCSIGLHVNADKPEYICFNQSRDVYTLTGGSLKLVDKFTYQGSSVSSTEKDINTRLAKAGIARFTVIWKSETTWTLTKRMEKKAWLQLHKNAASNIELVLEATFNKVRPPTIHHEKYQN